MGCGNSRRAQQSPRHEIGVAIDPWWPQASDGILAREPPPWATHHETAPSLVPAPISQPAIRAPGRDSPRSHRQISTVDPNARLPAASATPLAFSRPGKKERLRVSVATILAAPGQGLEAVAHRRRLRMAWRGGVRRPLIFCQSETADSSVVIWKPGAVALGGVRSRALPTNIAIRLIPEMRRRHREMMRDGARLLAHHVRVRVPRPPAGTT